MSNKKKIDWSNEFDKIKKLLIEGLSVKDLSSMYNIDSSYFRKKLIQLGLGEIIASNIDNRKKKSLDKKIKKKLNYYGSKDLPHTRKYLLDNLTRDINFKTSKGIILKEDFIEQYYLLREKSGNPIFNYDFSKVPEFIKDRHQKVTLIVNEYSPKTGKYLGEWEVSYKDLITLGADQGSLGGIKSREKTPQYINTEIFINRSIQKFRKDIYGYDRVNYVNAKTEVEIFCKHCNKYYKQKPYEHLNGAGLGCPECAMKLSSLKRAITTKEFINRLNNIFGKDFFDYSETVYVNSKTSVKVKDPITGEIFERYPSTLLEGRDPHTGRSRGEYFINMWFSDNNLLDKVSSEKLIKEIEGRELGEKHLGVYIDFVLELDNNVYWIEYNGKQHYEYQDKSFFHTSYNEFLRQVSRDFNVKAHCKNNNIVFIEIPYTYDTYEKISNILYSIFIEKQNPLDIIKVPEIKYRKEDQDEK